MKNFLILLTVAVMLLTGRSMKAPTRAEDSGPASPTPTASPRASVSASASPTGTAITIAPINGAAIPLTPPTRPAASPSTGSLDPTKSNLVVDPNAVPISGDQNLVVTGGSEFKPGQLFTGTLLCPLLGPGPKLVKGCISLFGEDPKLTGKVSGPATFRGPAKANECPSGFRDDGDYCAKPNLSAHCPEGWEDIGVSCKKPETKGNCAHYGRVAGQGAAFYDPRNGGECWTCPVLTHRSRQPVNSTNAKFPACTAGNDDGIVWQSAQYPEPGVAAFLDPLIVQLAFNDAAYVDAFLNKRKSIAHSKDYLWDQMVNAPNDSPEFKALIFAAILVAAEKDRSYSMRPGNAVSIFQDYIQKRRTYVAQDAVAMYDAYLDFNNYKQRQGTKSAMLAGGPMGFAGKGVGAVISSPQASLGATVGVAPDNYVNAAYSAAVPDKRGEEFMQALVALGGTPYQKPSGGSGTDPTAAIQLGVYVVGSATAMHDLLDAHKVIKGIGLLSGKSGMGIGLGTGLAGTVLDGVAAAMTLFAQLEAEKQYGQLVALADKPVSIAEILKSGTDEEKNSLIMWWALATSPYKASSSAREFPINDADVCARYRSQCGDIKRIVAKARLTLAPPPPVTLAPAPPEFLEQVKATAALARLLSSVNSTATATAVKPTVTDAVQRLSQATLEVKKLSGPALDAADQHKSELDTASMQIRKELTRIKGLPGVYPVLQSALGNSIRPC